MTSKVQQAKDAQGYTKTGKQCQSCMSFECDTTEIPNPFDKGRFTLVIKNKRCTFGNFAVQLTASCDFHKPHEESK